MKATFRNYSPIGFEGKKGLLLRPIFGATQKSEIVLKERYSDIFGSIIAGGIMGLLALILIYNYSDIKSSSEIAKFIAVLFIVVLAIGAISMSKENYKKLNSEDNILIIKINKQGIYNGKAPIFWEEINDVAILLFSDDSSSKFLLIDHLETITSINISSIHESKEIKELGDLMPSINSNDKDYHELRSVIGKYLSRT